MTTEGGTVTACIETTAVLSKNGYGRCRVQRFGKTIYYMHRLVWIDHHGRLPDPATPMILHTCDNPACVNIEHLYEGTHLDNMRDMRTRGRARRSQFFGVTHCIHGHEFTPENTYYHHQGWRTCRACCRIRSRARRKAAAA